MRNAIATMLAITMLATSALIALDLAALLSDPGQAATLGVGNTRAPGHEPLVRAFYAAANDVLAGGRSPLLEAAVSPRVQTHTSTDTTVLGGDGLRAYLEGIRGRGELSLHVTRLIDAGSDLAVAVEAREGATLRWRTVDLFRIDAGSIVRYWPGPPTEIPPPTLPSVTIPAFAANMGVSLTRLELSPGAEPTPLVPPAPHLIIVETGTLSISRGHPFALARSGESTFTPLSADSAADELRVGPGDAVLFPEVVPQLLRNAGTSSASVLSLLVAHSSLLFDRNRAAPSAMVTVEGMHDGWRVGRRTAWDNDTITETLAEKHLPEDPRASGVVLRGSQLLLDAGQRLPPLPPGALRLAIVRSGVVGVSVITSETVPISIPNPESQLAVASHHLFWAGDAFWIEASEAPVLTNAGVTPLDILLIEVTPLDDDPKASATASYATAPLET